MPIIVPDELPAKVILRSEGVNVIGSAHSLQQDIRPLRVALLNIMPTKIETETQWLRLLGASPLQIELTLLRTATHLGNVRYRKHLSAFYTTHEKVANEYFDALIITGAPVEHLSFEEVKYWDELRSILLWSKSHVFSTLHVCWGAQAGLYYHYDIPKVPLSEKLIGVFSHQVESKSSLFSGADDFFMAPHSRWTSTDRTAIVKHPKLSLLASSEEAGVYAAATTDLRQVFITGHPEYERDTLAAEYHRDKKWYGKKAAVPQNYFSDDSESAPVCTWCSHARLLAQNWLHGIYRHTPYALHSMEPVP